MKPGMNAVLSGFAAIVIGYYIFFARESPGTALAILQYVLFAMALVGLIGSLLQIRRR